MTSLKAIPLDPYFLAQLHTRPIIPEQAATVAGEATEAEETTGIQYTGGNRKKILVLVKHSEAETLPAGPADFLGSVLNACKLTMDDIAIVNTPQGPEPGLGGLIRQFGAQSCIVFGQAVSPLPPEAEPYAIRLHGSCPILLADDLASISGNKALKGKLWTALQQLFNLQG